MADGFYIDSTLAVAIGSGLTVAVSASGIVFTMMRKNAIGLQNRLDKSRAELTDVLKQQLTDIEKRRDLWEKFQDVIRGNTDALRDLMRFNEWLRDEVRRMGSELQRLSERNTS